MLNIFTPELSPKMVMVRLSALIKLLTVQCESVSIVVLQWNMICVKFSYSLAAHLTCVLKSYE